METIRHIALGCCIISTVAGMIRMFWPENGFAPVINAVLALYIITAALQMLRGTDWNLLTAEIYSLAESSPQENNSYDAYGHAVGLEVSAEAIRTVLQQADIEAVVQVQGEICRVELIHPADRQRAEQILAESCGTMAYTLEAGGSTP